MVNKTAKARPTDINLYNKTKKYIYKKYPKHSAYRSGLLVQKYKSNFTKKYGNKKQPYIGTKTRKRGLRRWFDEEWVNQRGEVGYKFKSDIYRPKNRITKDTPIIHDELTDKEIEKARSKKYRKGRIDRFRKKKKLGGDKGPDTPYDRYMYYEPVDDPVNEPVDEPVDEPDDDSEEEIFIHFMRYYKLLLIERFEYHANTYIKNNNNIDELEKYKDELENRRGLLFESINTPIDIDFMQDTELNNNLDETQLEIIRDYSSKEILDDTVSNDYINKLDNTKNIDLVKKECYILIRDIIYENTYKEFDNRLKESEKINPTYHGGKWSDKYKKSINCKNPKGFSQKQHCKYGKKGGKKTRKNIKPMKKEGKYYFKDYPDFKPNLSPREMFLLGSFGGTYWRPIYSGVLKKNLKNIHKKYPEEWWKNIPEKHLSSSECDININKYKVSVGTSLEFWESKGWIEPEHPYGWVHWYCDFFMGKRSKDDERQISRWKKLAGYKGRFMRFLVTQIINKNATWDDETISPKIRQVLQHWGYKLTKEDYSYEIKRRNK